MATIKDIAREANVSCMTVSNVIHGRTSKVSAETIKRVNEVIKKLDYTPNMYARSLVSNNSKIVAYINTNSDINTDGMFKDPFTATFIDSLEKSLSSIGYYLMVRTVKNADDLKRFLKNWKIDGLFFVGLHDTEMFHVVKNSNIPTVLIDSYLKHPQIKNIGLEDFNGGFIATEHLIFNGHKNIAFAAPSFHDNGVDRQRFEGYKMCLEKHHIKLDQSLLFDNRNFEHNGIKLGEAIAQIPDLTAVFATSDMLAIEIMRGMKNKGKSVPEDISVIGFDNIPLCELVTPRLTTICQDTALKGELAAKHMMECLHNKNPDFNDIILPVYLVERESVNFISK